MYSRQAKGIEQTTWTKLMNPVDWREVRNTIASNGPKKSAGLDGVNCDLVELHSEDSVDEPSVF